MVTCRPVFSLPGSADDQPGDDCAIAEGALMSADSRNHASEIVAQHVAGEQSGHVGRRRVGERPHGDGVVAGDRSPAASGRNAPCGASATCRASGASRPSNGPSDHEMPRAARKRLDQQIVAAGQERTRACSCSHSRTCCDRCFQLAGGPTSRTHAARWVDSAAGVGRDFRGVAVGAAPAPRSRLCPAICGSRRRTRTCRPASVSRKYSLDLAEHAAAASGPV